MLQIKKRTDSKSKVRFMFTICFYQDSRHEEPLLWIREVLGIGYFSRRNDGMSELRINGVAQVKNILKELLPYIRFKKHQALALCQAAETMENKTFSKLSKSELLSIVSCIVEIQNHNYATRQKKTERELVEMLGLTP